MEALALLLNTINSFISIYTVLLIIRILLTWFPNVDWYKQPFALLSQLTDPYLNVFRSVIPPLGGIDFSPMLAILLLQFVQSLIPAVESIALGFITSYFA